MKRSELRLALDAEFGALGQALLVDLALGRLGGRTGAEALADGVAARDVWEALCETQDVPLDRWHGRGLRAPDAAAQH